MGYKSMKSWVSFVTVPLKLARRILEPLYDVFFGWLDRRLAKQHESRLAADVKLSLSFLFTEEKGQIIPNKGVPFPPAFNYAFVTVAANGLFLRFIRGRGELVGLVAPLF